MASGCVDVALGEMTTISLNNTDQFWDFIRFPYFGTTPGSFNCDW